jgi:hypothetical protein
MSKKRNGTVPPLLLVAVIIAVVAAFFTTLDRIDTRTGNNEGPCGINDPGIAVEANGAASQNPMERCAYRLGLGLRK